MKRKRFSQLSPLAYKISVAKGITIRRIKNLAVPYHIARKKQAVPLPFLIYSHNSLIRRRLGNVDLTLQDNKAVNLALAAQKVTSVIIKPGQVFSFWELVGSCTAGKGYLEGLTISGGQTSSGIGGGMCQFTNLIHWMILHTPMAIIEHHHHDAYDLFPDEGRQIPFGSGTSILYNYMDYRFKNTTNITFQLITYTTAQHLCGELRADARFDLSYHIRTEDEFFSKENDVIYRNSTIYRDVFDVKTGNLFKRELIKKNHARVMYDLPAEKIR